MNYKYKLQLLVMCVARILIFGIFATIPVYSAITDGFLVSIKPRDIWPPSIVTDLFAENTSVEGQVKLLWTAPTENDVLSLLSSVEGYYIRYATFSVDSVSGDTTVWWNNATQITISYANEPGKKETFVLPTILFPGTSYYFAIKSYDNAEPHPNISPIDKKSSQTGQQAFAVPLDLPPAIPSELRILEFTTHYVTLSWRDLTPAEKTLDFDYYKIYRSSLSHQTNYVLIATTTLNTFTDKDINFETTYYYRVTAVDKPPLILESASSEYVVTQFHKLYPKRPVIISAVGNDRKITLQWRSNDESNLDGYNIYRSTYSGGYTTIPLNTTVIKSNSYEDTSVINGKIYYYVVTAVNKYGNESPHSTETSVIPRDNLPPTAVLGIRCILPADITTMTLKWSAVTTNKNGTNIDDLAGYNIYRSQSIDGNFVLKGFVPTGQPLEWVDREFVKGEKYYYTVRAIDTSENLSDTVMIVDSAIDTNITFTANDESNIYLGVPKNLMSIFYKENNKYGADIMIGITKNTAEESGDVIISRTFVMMNGTTGEIIKDFVFEKPVQIVFGNGNNNKISKTQSSTANQLSLFWFNGLEWVKMDTKHDSYFDTYTIFSKRLGKYALKRSPTSTSFEILSIQPDKIFTPNGDNWNDYFEIFYFAKEDSFVVGKIYDIKGRFVANMTTGRSNKTLLWDGKNDQGKVVSCGVYIYQIEVTGSENKILNGTCVVAK